MRTRYAKWMYEWESKLTSVDNNRVVRPLEWGLEYAHAWIGGQFTQQPGVERVDRLTTARPTARVRYSLAHVNQRDLRRSERMHNGTNTSKIPKNHAVACSNCPPRAGTPNCAQRESDR